MEGGCYHIVGMLCKRFSKKEREKGPQSSFIEPLRPGSSKKGRPIASGQQREDSENREFYPF